MARNRVNNNKYQETLRLLKTQVLITLKINNNKTIVLVDTVNYPWQHSKTS